MIRLALGWTLLHSLWQGALVALVLAGALFVLRSSRARYAAACIAMVALLAGFGVTLTHVANAGDSSATSPQLRLPNAPPDGPIGVHRATPGFQPSDILPWLAPFWVAGVIAFHLYSLASWIAARRLLRRGICAAPEPWQQRLVRLRERLRLSTPVLLLESSLTATPAVIGFLRPVVLVPIGMLTAMPAAQIESILLHELAHIRRHDYLVNLLQTLVEGFLFYHPAVWWVSSIIRAERENCCDDLAVALSGDAYQYASALATLEQTRWAANDAVLAANGGNLMKRVRRLLYPLEAPRTALSPVLSAAILTITAALALTAWQPKPQEIKTEATKTAYEHWLSEDVAYIIDDRERSAFMNLQTDAERDMFIQQFWERRDPTPGTVQNEFKEEYYRRIAYANDHFWSKLPGWKTDLGRIYIVFGPADEIESHPKGDNGKNFPYEQWLYHLIKGVGTNVIIEFDDVNSTGDYRMTKDPNPPKSVPR